MPLARTKARLTLAKLYSAAGTGYMYQFRRPRTSSKLELVKYDPIAGRHCLFTEGKPNIPGMPEKPKRPKAKEK